MSDIFIHPTADISLDIPIGAGTRIWHNVHIREGVYTGTNCIIGKNVYLDFGICIGDNVNIQNNALIYHGARIEDGCFIGPDVISTNDKRPRATNSTDRQNLTETGSLAKSVALFEFIPAIQGTSEELIFLCQVRARGADLLL